MKSNQSQIFTQELNQNIFALEYRFYFLDNVSLLHPNHCWTWKSFHWRHIVQRELEKDSLVEVAKQFRVALHFTAQSEFIRYHILRWYSCEFIYYSVWSMCACDTYAVCDHTGEEGGGGRRIVYKQYRETSTERINRGLSKIGYSLFGHYIIFFFLIVRIIVFCYV